MGRIEKRFEELKVRREKAFMPFVTACDPTPEATVEIVLALEKAGSDVVELGIAYSDPIADGPVIQDSYARVIGSGRRVKDALAAVAAIRLRSEIPIAAMVSYSIAWKIGPSRFAKDASDAGVDALIIPDLPPEEAGEMLAAAGKAGLGVVFLVTPVTEQTRLKTIVEASRPFIYYVSIVGTTGARAALPPELADGVRAVKKTTTKPVVVGFGVSGPEQAAAVAGFADGVIVGSAFVKVISEHRGEPARDVARAAAAFARPIVAAVKP